MERSFRLQAMGMVTALGSHPLSVLEHLRTGDTSGISKVEGYLPGRPVPLAMVRESLPEVPEELADYRSRNSSLLLSAYQQIAAAVQKSVQQLGADRVAVVLGSSTSGIAEGEKAIAALLQTGKRPTSYRYSQQEIGTVAEFLAAYAGLRGPAYTISTACSSSTKVFASARNLLAHGVADAVVVGGCDSLCKLTVNGFHSLGLLSDTSCIPFSKNRSGIVIGEGACLFLLTREAGGIQLLGVGESSDAHHISSPDPEGRGAQAAMNNALEDAKLSPKDICYLNLHGTGTQPNDLVEAQAVRKIFPSSLQCSSTKALSGHMLGASGAAELGYCWLCLNADQEQLPLPAHHWDGVHDEALPKLQLVPRNTSIPRPAAAVMLSNSFAFGGSNASVIIGRHYGGTS